MYIYSAYMKQKLKTFNENKTFDISKDEIQQLHEYSELKVKNV